MNNYNREANTANYRTHTIDAIATDIRTTDPQDGDVLMYDDSIREFKNVPFTTASTPQDEFIELIDTPSSYTTANALHHINVTTDGIDETTTTLTQPAANQFTLTRGTSAVVVTASCDIDQNLSTTSSVTHNDLTLATGTTVSDLSTDTQMGGLGDATGADTSLATEKAVKTYIDLANFKGYLPHGIDDADFPNINLDYTNATRTLTVTNTSGYPYYVWIKGKRFEVTGTMTSTNSFIEGIYIFYFYNNSGTLALTNTTYALGSPTADTLLDYVFMGQIYWSSSFFGGSDLGQTFRSTFPTSTHWGILQRLEASFPTTIRDSSTGILGDLTVDGDGSLLDHVQCSITGGRVAFFFDPEATLSSVAKAGTKRIGYYEWNALAGANLARFVDNTDGSVVISAPAGRAYYNQLVGAQYQLTEIQSGKFMCIHIFGVPNFDSGDSGENWLFVLGQTEYLTAASARNGSLTELVELQTDITSARIFGRIASLIIQTSDSYSNAYKSRIVSTGDGGSYVDFRVFDLQPKGGTGGGTSIVLQDHSLLSNLTADDHLQYVRHNGSRITSANTSIVSTAYACDVGSTITEFSIDGTMTGNSDAAVPTEKAVVTYIGNSVITSGNISVAVTGFSTSFNITIEYAYDGDRATINIPAVSATGNSTTASLTLPSYLYPRVATKELIRTLDNNIADIGVFSMTTSGVITVYQDIDLNSFGASANTGWSELDWNYVL